MGVLGVILGWPVVAVAYIPLAIFVLAAGEIVTSFKVAIGASSVVLVLSLLLDSIYYGKYTVSVLVSLDLYNNISTVCSQ